MMEAEMIKRFKEAKAVIISAANGFSISEGLSLFQHNEAFHEIFADYEEEGMNCILEGMMTNWQNTKQKWAFWSRLIDYYHFRYQPSSLMKNLYELVKDKDVYVLTTNGEEHFEKAGFQHVYEVEGSWMKMQCSAACHETLYDDEEAVRHFLQSGEVPKCPHCGRDLRIQMAAQGNMIVNKKDAEGFENFVRSHAQEPFVILELGVGPRNRLIKYPLMQLAAQTKATYITINKGQLYIPEEIQSHSYGIDDSLDYAIAELLKEVKEVK
jgi:NAD-dependent SIR2 family protein deacetylase